MRTTIIILLVTFSTGILAQTISRKFDTALDKYQKAASELLEFEKDTEMDFLDAEDKLADIEDELNSSAELLLEVNKSNAEGYLSSSVYYLLLCKEKLARVYNFNFNYDAAYVALAYITPFMDGTRTLKFPTRSKFKDKTFDILDSHWQGFKKEYLTTLLLTTIYLKKHNETAQCLNAYLKQNNLNAKEKHIALGMLIGMNIRNEYAFTTDETINNLTDITKSYYSLNQTDKTYLFSDTIHINAYKAISLLEKEVKNKTLTNQNITKVAEAVHTSAIYSDRSESLFNIYEVILDKYYTTTDNSGNQMAYNLNVSSRDFLTAAEKVARVSDTNQSSTGNDYLNLSFDILLKKEKEKAKQVALKATTLMADNAVLTQRCDDIDLSVSNFSYWKSDAQVKKYTALAETCRKKAKAEAEKLLRKQKMDRLNFNFYAGFYPIGMITKSDRMDIGGVVNFVNSKKAYEFSYLKVNKKKENYFDLWIQSIDNEPNDMTEWNGYYSHFQYKKFMNDSPVYYGLLLGYAAKDFEPFTSNIVNLQTSVLSSANFDPSTKQYIVMINNGLLSLRKGFGYDVFLGIGASYNIFDSGNKIDKTVYSIQNPTLQNRKDNYFSYMMRIGITLGLNIGKGNK